MCLISYKNEVSVAESDIRVWKAVKVRASDPSVWSGPYSHSDKVFPFDAKAFESGVVPELAGHKGLGLIVEGGFFHSYTDEYICEYRTYQDFGRMRMNGCRIAVCRCTVPAGSRYFTDANGYEIASDTIVVESPGDFSFDRVLDLNEKSCAYI